MNKDLVFSIIKRVIISSLFIVGIMFFVFKESKAIILGYIFGSLISILGFKLLHNTIEKAVTMPPGRANAYSTAHYMARFTIYGIVLGVAALADYLNFLSAILGLIMVKLVILLSAVFDKGYKDKKI